MRPKPSFSLTVLLAACLAGPALAAEPARKEGFVTVPDGTKIRWIEAGQGPGPTLLFIPGLTMYAEIWDQQIDHFAKTHRVVAVDPRSQGRSTKTSDGNFPASRARDYRAVIEQLKLAPVVPVCWSLAVSECLSYVDQFGTGSLAGLVLVDGLPGGNDPAYLPMMINYLAGFQRERQSASEAFVRTMYKKPQTDAYLKKVVDGSLLTPTDTILALFIGTLGADPKAGLAKIDKPTLVTVTEGIWLEKYKEMHKEIRGAKLEIFQAGHALFVDEAGRFNGLLDGFLGELGK